MVLLFGMVGCSDRSEQQKSHEPQQKATASLKPNQRPDWMAAPDQIPPHVAPPVQEPDRALLVGVVGPQTGEEASYGLQTLAGVEQAVREVNAQGGIFGQPLAVMHVDDGGSHTTAERAIRELLKQRVIAIIAAPTGWSTFAPVHLINESKTIFMAVGTRRNIGRSGPYIFRFALPEETAIDGLLRHVTNVMMLKRFALVTSSSQDFSLTLSSQFKQSVGKLADSAITLEADLYDAFSGQPDWPKIIKNLHEQSKEFQAVIFTGGVEEGAEMAKAMREVGMQHPIIGSEDFFVPSFLQAGGTAVEGTVLYSSHPPEKKGVTPERFAALAHDACSLLAMAIQKAGALQPSLVRKVLLSGEAFDGMTGRSGFTPQGEPIKQPFLYRVALEKNTPHFVPIVP
ncbi:MAG: ABC transporter substrate-binding protein [Magnetococcus sp. YQC-5]